jgi:hypothetical protein
MQILISTGTVAGSQPIYLPYDKAPVPFGDPLAGTVTSAGSGSGAAGGVFTVPGYLPTNGDAVSLSVAGTSGFLTSLATVTSQAQPNVTYYVTSASADTFSITSVKAGAATPASVIAVTSTLGQNGGQLFVHLLSNQVDGTVIPFKPGNTVVAWNAGNAGTSVSTAANAYTAINLLGAADLNTTLATGTYGAPLGPSTWNVIATIGFGAPVLVQLKYDWIVASNSTATLVLIQN